MVEQRPFKAWVAGSNPAALTKISKQIRDGKQAHSDIAEIDAQSMYVDGSGEYLHGGVQQLALQATPVLFGFAFENHLVRQ